MDGSRFASSRVIVTAAGNGIGRCIAEAFLAEGAHVHALDIDASALVEFASEQANLITTALDVADEAAVIALFKRQKDELGGLDILINCAGIKGPTAAVKDITLEDWRHCQAINMDATFICSREALSLMYENQANRRHNVPGIGSIVNISSTAGWHGYPLRSAYSASKWAMIGFTKSLAMEVGRDGIRANVICPGTVAGQRMQRVVEAEARHTGAKAEDILDGYRRACSMRELIDVEDIAAMALFLCSTAAAKITGQIMNVDGQLEAFCV